MANGVSFVKLGRVRDERPVIVAVDPDGDAIRRIAGELGRYDRDYRIACGRSVEDSLGELEAMRRSGDRVAVVLAARGEGRLRGEELLERVSDLHPHAKRGLLIEFGAWGDEETAAAIRNAMTRGHIDYYVLKPWSEPDELFHRTICEFLHEWRRGTPQGRRELTVVADRFSPRGFELRNLLARNGVPHAFHTSDSDEGRRLLGVCGREQATEPIVLLPDDRVLVDPSNQDLAEQGYRVRDPAGTGRGPVRRRRRGRRPLRPRRSDVRLLGRAPGTRRRAGVDRRPGGLERSGFATTSASSAASQAASSRRAPTSKRGSSARTSC